MVQAAGSGSTSLLSTGSAESEALQSAWENCRPAEMQEMRCFGKVAVLQFSFTQEVLILTLVPLIDRCHGLRSCAPILQTFGQEPRGVCTWQEQLPVPVPYLAPVQR